MPTGLTSVMSVLLFLNFPGKGCLMAKHRVVVTGVGVVAPNGVGKEAFWQALMKGLSGVRPIRRFDPLSCGTSIAGEIQGFDPLQYFERQELKKVDRSNVYA